MGTFKLSWYGTVRWVRNGMIAVNCAMVLLICSVNLLATRYVIASGRSMEFLEKLGHVPFNPQITMITAVVCMGFLVYLLLSRDITVVQKLPESMLGAIVETALGFALCIMMNMSYSGILMLVFCDSIFHFRQSRKTTWLLALQVVLFLAANQRFVSMFIPLPDPDVYFQAFGNGASVALLLSKRMLDTLNTILCIAYLAVYIAWQVQEKEDLAEEAQMLSQVNSQLRSYAAVTEKIGEDKERKRLAREIHDTLGHALTGIAAGVDACYAMIDKSPQAAKSQLSLVSKVVRQGITDVRSSLNKLRPGALEQQGFKGALQRMTEEFASVADLEITLDFQADGCDFDVAKEDVLFRMIQECVTNSMRHGAAKRIDISLFEREGLLHVIVRDNGKGCEVVKPGYGLLQMQERITTIHGHVDFTGEDGFTVHAVVPLLEGENRENARQV